MSERVRIALFLVAVLVAAAIAGTSDFDEARREESAYCQHVASGEWPAYRDNVECKEAE